MLLKGNHPLNKLAKLRRHASRVHFAKILFGNSKISPTGGPTNGRNQKYHLPTNRMTWEGARETWASKKRNYVREKNIKLLPPPPLPPGLCSPYFLIVLSSLITLCHQRIYLIFFRFPDIAI